MLYGFQLLNERFNFLNFTYRVSNVILLLINVFPSPLRFQVAIQPLAEMARQPVARKVGAE